MLFPKLSSFLAALLLFAVPLVSFAAPANFGELVTLIINSILKPLVTLIFGFAFVMFLWGMFQYIRAANEGGKEEARNTILYGLIGLFVMVSVWGLVRILTGTFDVSFVVPQLQRR